MGPGLATRRATAFGRGSCPASSESRRSLHRQTLRPRSPSVQDRAVAGLIRPVLKHGPRSLTCVRVSGWQTPTRRETKFYMSLYGRIVGGATGSFLLPSKSTYVGTRKMVNYACAG